MELSTDFSKTLHHKNPGSTRTHTQVRVGSTTLATMTTDGSLELALSSFISDNGCYLKTPEDLRRLLCRVLENRDEALVLTDATTLAANNTLPSLLVHEGRRAGLHDLLHEADMRTAWNDLGAVVFLNLVRHQPASYWVAAVNHFLKACVLGLGCAHPHRLHIWVMRGCSDPYSSAVCRSLYLALRWYVANQSRDAARRLLSIDVLEAEPELAPDNELLAAVVNLVSWDDIYVASAFEDPRLIAALSSLACPRVHEACAKAMQSHVAWLDTDSDSD